MSQPTALRVVRADNPSPLTGPGTNTFLIGTRDVAVVDPGPADPAHVQAILAAAEGRISHILITHAHLDHSAGAPLLARATGAPVFAFGDCDTGRSPTMTRLASGGLLAGGEGRDTAFRPDVTLADDDVLSGADWTVQAIRTPGHMGGHLSFRVGDRVLCGDVVMGWSTTLISPPDGDLVDYFRSLDRLAGLGANELLPAHGDPIADPPARLAELAAHRRQRSAQILSALDAAPGTAADLAARLYSDIPPALLPVAARNVLAHLVALADLGAVTPQGEPSATVTWERAAPGAL